MSKKKLNIDHLADSYLEQINTDPNLLDDILREHGYDPQKLERQGIQIIRKLLFQQQVAANKEKLSGLYLKALSMVHVAAAGTKEAVFSLLKQKSPSLQFKNLEKLDEENLRQILTETEILELIEKLEKEDTK